MMKIAKRTFEIFYRFYARFSRLMVEKDSSNIIYLVGGIIAKNINFFKRRFYVRIFKK